MNASESVERDHGSGYTRTRTSRKRWTTRPVVSCASASPSTCSIAPVIASPDSCAGREDWWSYAEPWASGKRRDVVRVEGSVIRGADGPGRRCHEVGEVGA